MRRETIKASTFLHITTDETNNTNKMQNFHFPNKNEHIVVNYFLSFLSS